MILTCYFVLYCLMLERNTPVPFPLGSECKGPFINNIRPFWTPLPYARNMEGLHHHHPPSTHPPPDLFRVLVYEGTKAFFFACGIIYPASHPSSHPPTTRQQVTIQVLHQQPYPVALPHYIHCVTCLYQLVWNKGL